MTSGSPKLNSCPHKSKEATSTVTRNTSEVVKSPVKHSTVEKGVRVNIRQIQILTFLVAEMDSYKSETNILILIKISSLDSGMKEVTTGQSGLEILIFRLMQLTAAVVKKSLSFQMLTDLEIKRGTYHFRHPVSYVY